MVTEALIVRVRYRDGSGWTKLYTDTSAALRALEKVFGTGFQRVEIERVVIGGRAPVEGEPGL